MSIEGKRNQVAKTRVPPFNKKVYDQISDQLLRDISPELDDWWFIVDFGYRATIKVKL